MGASLLSVSGGASSTKSSDQSEGAGAGVLLNSQASECAALQNQLHSHEKAMEKALNDIRQQLDFVVHQLRGGQVSPPPPLRSGPTALVAKDGTRRGVIWSDVNSAAVV